MQAEKEITTTIVHEFWMCKDSLKNFYFFLLLCKNKNCSKEVRIQAFSAYGYFLLHLYSFYEGYIKNKNKGLLKGLKNFEKGEKISNLLTEEVKKIIRNYNISNQQKAFMDIGINILDLESEALNSFGKHLRHIRNRFSHVLKERVNNKDVSLSEFYKTYHKYAMLLYLSVYFSWNIDTKENYDWIEIEKFSNEILSGP